MEVCLKWKLQDKVVNIECGKVYLFPNWSAFFFLLHFIDLEVGDKSILKCKRAPDLGYCGSQLNERWYPWLCSKILNTCAPQILQIFALRFNWVWCKLFLPRYLHPSQKLRETTVYSVNPEAAFLNAKSTKMTILWATSLSYRLVNIHFETIS